MDAEETSGQSGKTGDTATSPRPSPSGADGNTSAFQDRPGRPGTGDNDTRPYTLTPVETLDQAIGLAEWLTGQAGETIGLAEMGEGKYWGFASEEEGWEMAVLRGTAEEVIRQSLKKSLTQTDGISFVVINSHTAIPLLSKWLDLSVQEVASRVVGEIEALLHATGRIAQFSWWWASDEAYDVLSTEKHWKREAPPYYTAVGLPRALSAFSPSLREDEDGIEWRIAYDDLFLRVVAHYTREPVLVRAFMEEQDPVPRMGELLGIEDPDVTYAALVWSTLNWDTAYMQQRHPTFFDLLPPELDSLRQGVEAKLSVLSLGLSRAREDYTRNKVGSSVWGRKILWGADMGDVLSHQFMGSVSDLVDLLVVSLQQNLGTNVSVSEPEYSPTDRTIILRGRVTPVQEHYDLLKSVARLGNPLGVDLNPSIIIGN